MDDFYVILPSNACSDTHPENVANKYIISWENPINLTGQWKVALTEANFNYINSSVSTEFAIDYDVVHFDVIQGSSNLGIRGDSIGFADDQKSVQHPLGTWNPTEIFDDDHYIYMISKHNFEITFPDMDKAKFCGFTKLKNQSLSDSEGFYLRADNAFPRQEEEPEPEEPEPEEPEPEESEPAEPLVVDTVSLTYEADPPLRKVYGISIRIKLKPRQWATYSESLDEQQMKSPEDLVAAILKKFPIVFSKFVYVDGNITFQLKENISGIRLRNGLNFVLGFEHVKFTRDPYFNIIILDQVASHPPQMNRGINNIYIYASICKPIHVGGVMVPLLKSIWLDVGKKEYSFGEKYCVVIKNPMYLPVDARTINSMEINVRSDSGRLIPFTDGSVTSLTLHFKKFGL